jgi:PIN domain nuclease of toxin-antitoxin system
MLTMTSTVADGVLLDTHVWVWAAEGDARRVGPRARRLLTRAGKTGTGRISPVSIFEVAALHTLGRLRFALPVEAWIHGALDQMHLRIAPVAPEVSLDAGLIPRGALADPLDRLLVATARYLGSTLVTADDRILEYASDTSAVRTHDARI